MDLTENIRLLAAHQLGQRSNPPILGRVSGSVVSSEFRDGKLALKEKGYPLQETLDFVNTFYKRNRDVFTSQLNKGMVIVPVPSGSGKNLVTELFAQKIAHDVGCARLPAGLIAKTHLYEAKHNLSVEMRVKNPIGYSFDVEEVNKFVKGRPIIVLDDLIGSGESAVKLRKTLEQGGLRVNAFINLVTIEKSYPTVNDVTRVVGKLVSFANQDKGLEYISLVKDVCDLFGDYTRQKLNRFERDLNSEKKAIDKIENVKAGADLERSYTIGEELPNQYEKRKNKGLHRRRN